MARARRAPIPPHGTRARYVHRSMPCRCVECCTAQRRYMEVWRARAAAVVCDLCMGRHETSRCALAAATLALADNVPSSYPVVSAA